MIKVYAEQPERLLNLIYEAIEGGRVVNWESTANGSFTYNPPSGQWKNVAWLRPVTDEKSLTLNIIRPKGARVSQRAYAVYHARFSEMLLEHFDSKLTVVRLTALAGDGDLV